MTTGGKPGTEDLTQTISQKAAVPGNGRRREIGVAERAEEIPEGTHLVDLPAFVRAQSRFIREQIIFLEVPRSMSEENFTVILSRYSREQSLFIQACQDLLFQAGLT